MEHNSHTYNASDTFSGGTRFETPPDAQQADQQCLGFPRSFQTIRNKHCTLKHLAALYNILCNPPSPRIMIQFYSLLNNQSSWYRIVNQQPTVKPIALFPERFCPWKASGLKIINGITNRNETCIQKWQNQGDFCISRKTDIQEIQILHRPGLIRFYSAFETIIPGTNGRCVTQYWTLSTSGVLISSIKCLKTQLLPYTTLCVSIGKTNSMSLRRLLGVPR